jgi:hypothetical protein
LKSEHEPKFLREAGPICLRERSLTFLLSNQDGEAALFKRTAGWQPDVTGTMDAEPIFPVSARDTNASVRADI